MLIGVGVFGTLLEFIIAGRGGGRECFTSFLYNKYKNIYIYISQKNRPIATLGKF